MAGRARRVLLNYLKRFVPALTILLVVIGLLVAKLLTAYGEAQLLNRSITLGSSVASASTNYVVGITSQNANTIGSVEISFCSNSPIQTDPCTAPVGFTAIHATLTSMTGTSGFTISNASTSNSIILSRSAALQPAQAITFTLSNVVNPSSSGSYYGRIQTFASTDASGNPIDYGGIALAIASSITVSAQVPPYLIFCTGVNIPTYNCNQATGTGIDFGDLSPNRTAAASSQVLVATNAANGYDVTVGGTTMTSGNNVIGAITSPDVSRAGTNQFGMNLRSNVAPAVGSDPNGPGSGQPLSGYNSPNYYQFNSGDEIASSNVANDYRRYTISYIINITRAQPPGVYVSTLTYTGAGNF